MKVKRLPSDLVNQIAAGEVVERPASVVKELLENALDAGATRVRVELDAGGMTRVRVSDDGEGMDQADAELALERHATSKIARIEDLTRIDTFGFRGEALPSIASVSKLTLTTRLASRAEGVEIVVEGGGASRVRPCGCAVGTTVEVTDLFFNVPARRKFLKAQGTEAAHVSEALLLAALARPDVTFVLVRDGRVVREHLRVQTRQDRVAQALGEDRLAITRGERGPMAFEAHLAPPERARSGALALHLFVNGRPVRDRALARAVAQAYGSVLEPGKYPIGVIYLDIAPELVDVNVHPQKAEVRFSDARAVQDALARELNKALTTAFNLPSGGPLFRQITKPSAVNIDTSTTFDNGERESLPPYSVDPETVRSVAEEPQQLFGRGGFYSRLRYVGQVKATYLVCEGEDGLYVLDQHAAAERVTFHRLRRAFAAREVATQKLLVPEVVQLQPAEVAILEEAASEAAQLGVELRAVGPSAVAVHAVPKILARARPETVVRDLLAELGRAAKRPFRDAADLVLATMACHGSVRAGDVLSKDEAEALLFALDEVDFAGHCPHGRPVVTRLGWEDLERRVGR